MNTSKFIIAMLMSVLCCLVNDAPLHAGHVTSLPAADSSGNIIIPADGNITFTAKSDANNGTVTIDPSSTFGPDGTPSNYTGVGGTGTVLVTYDDSATGKEENCKLYIDHKDPNNKTCSSTASPPATFAVFIPTIKTTTFETIPSDPANDRTTIGIGEQVYCDVMPANTPGSDKTTWDNSGSGAFNVPMGADVIYSAYSNKENDKVTATLGDANFTKVTVTFNVLVPTSFADINQNDVQGSQNPLGCGFIGLFYAGPDSVNFYNCGLVEGTCSATTTGCFSSEQGAVHDPTGNGQGNGPPTPVNFGNTVLANYGTALSVTDHSSTQVPSGATANPKYNPPYNPGGTFLWPIPENWALNGIQGQFDTANSYYWVTISANNTTATINHSKGGTGGVASCQNPVTGTNVP